ncbi:MAG: DUF1127 domain-containing protein [Aestuariivirga sp.]
MRNYILNEAAFRDGAFAFPLLRRILRNWFSRRYLQKLEQFDDYMLSDIGLTRADLYRGQSLPYDVDPIAELMRFRDRRIARGQRRA